MRSEQETISNGPCNYAKGTTYRNVISKGIYKEYCGTQRLAKSGKLVSSLGKKRSYCYHHLVRGREEEYLLPDRSCILWKDMAVTRKHGPGEAERREDL